MAKKENGSTALAAPEEKGGLMVIDTQDYLALRDGGEIAEAMRANLGEGASLRENDLTRIPIPTGGGTTWQIPSLNGDISAKAIEGILIYHCKRGLLWKSTEPEEGSLPVLVSHDLRTAKIVAPDNVDEATAKSIAVAGNGELFHNAGGVELHREYDWEKLPQNEWGSGKNSGKAAKEQRVLYILTPDSPLPYVVMIQPGSLRDWQKFLVRMATEESLPYYRAVIRLTLAKETSKGGQVYAQVVPEIIGKLSAEQGKAAYDQLGSQMEAVASRAFLN